MWPLCVSCRFNIYGVMWNQSALSVLVGVHALDANETSQRRHKIQQIVLHKKYLEQKPRYDIALLQLNSTIEYNKQTRPICVDASVFPAHSKCIVSGWGSTEIIGQTPFLSRVSILLLTRDIDIVILSVRPSVRLSVRPSVRDTLVLYENDLTYRHSFSTVR